MEFIRITEEEFAGLLNEHKHKNNYVGATAANTLKLLEQKKFENYVQKKYYTVKRSVGPNERKTKNGKKYDKFSTCFFFITSTLVDSYVKWVDVARTYHGSFVAGKWKPGNGNPPIIRAAIENWARPSGDKGYVFLLSKKRKIQNRCCGVVLQSSWKFCPKCCQVNQEYIPEKTVEAPTVLPPPILGKRVRSDKEEEEVGNEKKHVKLE